MTHGPPPENELTLSSTAAAQRLGLFTSQLISLVREGLVDGWCYYRLEEHKQLTWRISHADIVALISEGGRNGGIEKRRRERIEQ